jgi:transposase
MADPLHVDDGFWAVPEPLLPERVSQRIGRPRVDDRIAFTAILFVLVTGVPWRVLPRELGCSGVTAWRRLRDWQAAGVWDRLHRELLRLLNALGRLDWSTGVVDGSHIRALRGLRIRWERHAALHYAFVSLGCSLICWRHIRP